MANKLKFTEQYIEITCDRGDIATAELTALIPYIHRNRTNTVFRTTLRNIDLVLRIFRGIDVIDPGVELPPVIARLLDKELRRRSASKVLIELGPDGDGVEEHITLMGHQQLGRELARYNDKFAFFYDTRTGKTPMSLQIIQDDIEMNPDNKWLVLCPLILIENAWLPDANSMFPRLSVVNLHDTTRAKRLARFKQRANVYVSNIESYIQYQDEIKALGIHGCVVDESSTMKAHGSKFAKAAVDLAWSIKRWYILSGTPAPNGEFEYYRQIQSVDFYGIHQSWTQFKEYFFNNSSRNPQYEKLKLKPEREDEFTKLLQQYSLYVDKEDVLTTPGRDFIVIPLKLPGELRENYEQLKKELALELGEGLVITAPSTAASINKLNQVTSGFIIDTYAMKYNKMVRNHTKHGGELAHAELMQENHLLSMYRYEELRALLNSVGDKQAIIWANYHKEFGIIKEMLGDNCGLVYGKTSITEKNEAIKAFKEGRIQYLVANPASADKGLTLTNAHIAIYFSLGYSYELWKQSIERIYGDISKQPNKCSYYIFITGNTVDRVIYNTVQTKGDMSTAMLKHLKGGR